MIKAPCSLRCVYVPRDPDGPFVSHCLASTKGPSAHFGGAEESKPQSLKSHLTAISNGALPQQRPRPPTSSCKSKVPPPPPPPRHLHLPYGSMQAPKHNKVCRKSGRGGKLLSSAGVFNTWQQHADLLCLCVKSDLNWILFIFLDIRFLNRFEL